MKSKLPESVEKYRITKSFLASDASYGCNGAFIIPYRSADLMVIISDQNGWDHVSVSTEHRSPTWDEMCFIKSLFFEPEEIVIQYHPPESRYIDCCKNCLHMWRKQNHDYELPPSCMV